MAAHGLLRQRAVNVDRAAAPQAVEQRARHLAGDGVKRRGDFEALALGPQLLGKVRVGRVEDVDCALLEQQIDLLLAAHNVEHGHAILPRQHVDHAPNLAHGGALHDGFVPVATRRLQQPSGGQRIDEQRRALLNRQILAQGHAGQGRWRRSTRPTCRRGRSARPSPRAAPPATGPAGSPPPPPCPPPSQPGTQGSVFVTPY